MAETTDQTTRRSWWEPLAPYAAVLILILIGVRIWVVWQNARAEKAALQQTATQLGMVYEGSDAELTERCAKHPEFGLPAGVSNYEDVLRRDAAQYSAYVFTHVRIRNAAGTRNDSRVYYTTVWAVHLKDMDMPYWCIYPQGHDTSGIYDAMASQIVKLPPSAFSTKYVLWAAKPAVTAEAISEKARALLAQHPGWVIEGKGSMLLLYHPKQKAKPDEFDAPLRLLLDLMNRIFGTTEENAP